MKLRLRSYLSPPGAATDHGHPGNRPRVRCLSTGGRPVPAAFTRGPIALTAAALVVGGLVILLSQALGWRVHPAWVLPTAFVGANLVQSAFTGWCPLMSVLRKVGVLGGEKRPAG